MAVYIPTLHSKIRYYERVEENYSRRDETIRLAKKYGLRLKDIPKQYHRERKFMGNNKIYYNDKIYIFTDCRCYILKTIYNNTSDVLRELFNKKELNRKKSKDLKYKTKLVRKYIKVEDNMYKVTYSNSKITNIKLVNYYKRNFKIDSTNIDNKISNILNGKYINCEDYIDMKDCSQMDRAIYYEVLRIPSGKTITYKMLASRLNNKYSVQAIAGSLKRCPFSLLIPSHRVIRSDGKLGSYCLDTDIKKRLLEQEVISHEKSN